MGSKKSRMYPYSDGRAGVEDLLAADEHLGTVHSDGADDVLPQMLRHLEHEADAVVEDLERGDDGQEALIEPHVDDSADDLADLAVNSSMIFPPTYFSEVGGRFSAAAA
jgi:hypothetical protein